MIDVLKHRFPENPIRRRDMAWEDVEKRLCGNQNALAILERMEESGGEPDTIQSVMTRGPEVLSSVTVPKNLLADAEVYAMTMQRS